MTNPTQSTILAEPQSLLNDQLAGIAETLARASRRRDEEVRRVREREAMKSAVSVPVSALTSVPGLGGSVEENCGDESVPFGSYDGVGERVVRGGEERVDDFVREACGDGDEEEQKDTLSGRQGTGLTSEIPSTVDGEKETTQMSRSVEGGGDARCDLDETFERLMAEMRSFEAEEAVNEEADQVSNERKGYEDAKQPGGNFNQQDECPSRLGSDLEIDGFAHHNGMEDSTTHNMSACSPSFGDTTVQNDHPTTLLAELRSLRKSTYEPKSRRHKGTDDADLKRMLSEFNISSAYSYTKLASDEGTDPRQMLAALASLSNLGITNNGLSTSSALQDENNEDGDEDLNILHAKLENLRSSNHEYPSLTPATDTLDKTTKNTSALPQPDPKLLPYIIALHLETQSLRWEYIQRWTTHLFSRGITSTPNLNLSPSLPTTKQDETTAIQRAESRLQNIITSVLNEEQARRKREEETKLLRRIVVTNLAAAAEKEDVERVFWGCRWDITSISLLPTRDPLKRTQTAHIDFVSREAAIRAERVSGQVFGLVFAVGLAVPVAVPQPDHVEMEE